MGTAKWHVGQKVYLRDVNERRNHWVEGSPPVVEIVKVGRTRVYALVYGREKAFSMETGREGGKYDHAWIQTVEDWAEAKAKSEAMKRLHDRRLDWRGYGPLPYTAAQINEICDLIDSWLEP